MVDVIMLLVEQGYGQPAQVPYVLDWYHCRQSMWHGSLLQKAKRALPLPICQKCLGIGAATFVTADEVVIFFIALIFFKFIHQEGDSAATFVCTPLL